MRGNGKGKEEKGEGKLRQGKGWGVVPHPKQKSDCVTGM